MITHASMRYKYRMMPGREAVTFRDQTAFGTYTNYAISDAWKRSLGDREKAASRGVYVEFELSWHIPKVLLSVDPMPGDIVLDSSGNSHTVLAMDDAGGQSVWKLRTVNLVLAAALKDSIDIQRPTITYDGSGVSVRAWSPGSGSTPYATLACRIQPINAEIAEERALRGFRVTHEIYLASQVTLGADDRVKNLATSAYLIVRGYHSTERIDELPVIDAELVP